MRRSPFLAFLLAAAFACAQGGEDELRSPQAAQESESAAQPRLPPPPGAPPLGEEARRTPIVRIVERVAPAVVNIAAQAMVRAPDPFFGPFLNRPRLAQSLGSGLVVSPNGIVVTNAHVIEGASQIRVTLADGRELEADVLGSDRESDLAVLKVDAGDLPAVPLGSSAELLIGETVVAIGNPFGLSNTVTSGVLSARGRSVPSESGERMFTDFLQTDASINPGNSGGPLVNLAGEVVGINTAIQAGAEGIGFAIPADRARRVVEDLLRFGELPPVWTGLQLLTVDPEMARRFQLPVERGVLVESVHAGSPAAAAGFRAGDLLVAVAERPVTAREEILTALSTVAPGTPLPVGLLRDGRTRELALVAERPPAGLGIRLLEETVGLEVAEARRGLQVEGVHPGSPAARSGLRSGDQILAANGQAVRTREELSRQVMRATDRGGILLVVGRGGFAYYLNFRL